MWLTVIGHIRGTCTLVVIKRVFVKKISHPGAGAVDLAADVDGLHLDRASINFPPVGHRQSRHLWIDSNLIQEVFLTSAPKSWPDSARSAILMTMKRSPLRLLGSWHYKFKSQVTYLVISAF